MNKMSSKFTVFFENPFWIGVYERETSQGYEVCKVLFGSEPKGNEVYEFMLKNFRNLKFSYQRDCAEFEEKKINPKRLQREVRKVMQNEGIGTKAQNALKLQHENCKTERKLQSKQRKEAYERYKFELKQEKRKQKHNGH